jgi:hypothetical protein
MCFSGSAFAPPDHTPIFSDQLFQILFKTIQQRDRHLRWLSCDD